MANDIGLSPKGAGILASEYARTVDERIQIRGTIFPECPEENWSANSFTPNEARKLAKYILELANDAERNSPEVKDIAHDLKDAAKAGNASYEDLALHLVKMGYHK